MKMTPDFYGTFDIGPFEIVCYEDVDTRKLCLEYRLGPRTYWVEPFEGSTYVDARNQMGKTCQRMFREWIKEAEYNVTSN